MDLKALLDDPPKVHEHEGQLVLWGLPRSVLDFVDAHVTERSNTLETGAGLSTILFALKGGSHICITPSQEEVDRIRDYCKRRGVSLQHVDFRIDLSANVLPKLGPVQLDLALIDGCHGFPTPFMDWYFISSSLKIGGTLIIDDVQIWTGHILKEFLLAEREWKLIDLFTNKTAIFVKEQSYRPWKEFVGQPYVLQQSEPLKRNLQQSEPLNRNESKFRRGLHLLRRGQILTLVQKMLKQIKG
jgi:hypothetical protein